MVGQEGIGRFGAPSFWGRQSPQHGKGHSRGTYNPIDILTVLADLLW